MTINIEGLKLVGDKIDDLYDFLHGDNNGLDMSEGHDFTDVIEAFIDERKTPEELRLHIDQVSGATGIGIALHAYLERELITNGESGKTSEGEKEFAISVLFRLFDSFAKKRTQLITAETSKLVSDVICYLDSDNTSKHVSTSDVICRILYRKKSEGKSLLLSLFNPEKISKLNGERHLYKLLVVEINKSTSFSVWAKKNLPERYLSTAYSLTNDKDLLKVMNRKSRGESMANDLGM